MPHSIDVQLLRYLCLCLRQACSGGAVPSNSTQLARTRQASVQAPVSDHASTAAEAL